MLLALGQADLDQWKESLHSYEKGKRTKRPFGKIPPETEKNFKSEIQNKQMRFNPVLQSFRDEKELSKTIEHEEISRIKDHLKHMKNNYKYTVDYDIINMHPSYSLSEGQKSQSLSHDNRKKQYKDPTYIDFDIINGHSYAPSYLDKRSLKHQRQYQRKIVSKDNRSYDIIKGSYTEKHHQNSSKLNQSKEANHGHSRQLNSSFDPLSCRYSNPEDEQSYHQKEKETNQRNKAQENLPPSYRYRESFTLDPNQPLPPIVQALDKKQQLAKARYKQRYEIEQEYKWRNQYERQQQEVMAKNRVHHGRIMEAKTRQFNILNARQYDSNRIESLYGKEVPEGTYDLRPFAKQAASPIRQSGFGSFVDRSS